MADLPNLTYKEALETRGLVVMHQAHSTPYVWNKANTFGGIYDVATYQGPLELPGTHKALSLLSSERG